MRFDLSRSSPLDMLPRTHRQSDLAYIELQRLILEQAIAPGSLLNESELMTRLGVGRTPLREALQRLAGDGLVVVVPRRGTIVKAVTAEDARQIYEVRIELEALAARLAAARATEEDLADLDAALAESETAIAEDSNVIFDQRMHQLVARATHNSYLVETLSSYYTLSIRWLQFVRVERESLDAMRADHGTVVAAIKRRDPDVAAAAARTHLRVRLDRLGA